MFVDYASSRDAKIAAEAISEHLRDSFPSRLIVPFATIKGTTSKTSPSSFGAFTSSAYKSAQAQHTHSLSDPCVHSVLTPPCEVLALQVCGWEICPASLPQLRSLPCSPSTAQSRKLWWVLGSMHTKFRLALHVSEAFPCHASCLHHALAF